jgi:hypothetical protein
MIRFQKYQLANRLLVFTPTGQVYFSCNSSVYSEDVIDGPALEMEPATFHGARTIKIQPNPEQPWSTYRRAVEAYTSRVLSYQGDALDAFSGILRSLHSGRCVEAIPVAFLDVALLWQPSERLIRRESFSSWSWVGWIGKVCYDTSWIERGEKSELQALSAWRDARTWIIWHSATRTNAHVPAQQLSSPSGSRNVCPENAMQNRRFRRQHDTINPTPQILFERSRLKPETGSRGIRYLQFWTMSLRCRIKVDLSAVLRYSSPRAENTGNGLRRFEALDDTAQTCGWVLLDQEWIEMVAKRNAETQEFILLSEADETEGSDEPLGDGATAERCRAFNAMMIVWSQGIAERVGVGRISARMGQKGEWKEILLG